MSKVSIASRSIIAFWERERCFVCESECECEYECDNDGVGCDNDCTGGGGACCSSWTCRSWLRGGISGVIIDNDDDDDDDVCDSDDDDACWTGCGLGSDGSTVAVLS